MAMIVVFGAGDIARLADFYFESDSEHQVVGFTVDAEYRSGDTFLGRPLVAFDTVETAFPPERFGMFVALSYGGMNHPRAEKVAEARSKRYRLVSYVSSRCSWLSESPIGENCLVLEDNTIQPFVSIGDNVTLWSGNHIGHDSVIEDNCFVSSHVVVSGHCRVGAYSFLGVNATLHDSVRLAPETLVGAGAVISRDTAPGGVYLPARGRSSSRTSRQVLR